VSVILSCITSHVYCIFLLIEDLAAQDFKYQLFIKGASSGQG